MQRISHYEIVRPLGRGGMGEVFEAVDLHLGRRVALKFVAPAFAGDPEALRRFEREARAAAALQHPRIATLFAFDRSAERPFLVMELLEGRTLRSVLAEGPLPIAEALAIAREVAGALAFAHRRGVVHRDIKPENLMFDAEGGIKVTDFGLARTADASQLTTSGAMPGTAAYMAPEGVKSSISPPQDAAAGGGPPGAPADVFALGVTLHEMLAGATPFGGESPLAVLYSIVNQPPRPLRGARPDVPDEVERLVARMLEKDPAVRPPADAVARELAALTGVPVPAPSPSSERAAPETADSARATLPFQRPSARDTLPTPGAGGAPGITQELSAERRPGGPPAVRTPAPRRSGPRRLPAPVVVLGLALVVATVLPWLDRQRSATPSRRAVAFDNQGHDSLRAGNLAAARERFEAALALAPRYPEAKLNLATVLQRLGEADRAAALYGEVIAQHRGRADLLAAAHYGLGEIDLQSHAWPSAIEHLAEAARRDPGRVEYPNNLGFALIQSGRTDDALATLRAARARFPGEATLLKNLALAWLRAGRPDSARAAASEAVRLRPAYAEAWSLKARGEAGLGDLAAARTSLETLRSLDPGATALAEAETAVREAATPPDR
jgi:serine/threonine-protein kinase